MSRVLIAWEFGSRTGHLAQLVPLAERLRGKGHRVTFALRDVTRADGLLGHRGFEYLQAPVWHPRPRRSAAAPCNFSELLEQHGYADGEGLLGMLKAWREIYKLVDPHVIVFEHAPTALLASRGFEAARVLYGVGFSSPPRVTPFPSFRTWEVVARERLEASDARVLGTINAALRKLRLRPLEFAHEIFEVDHEFLCTFPELDHYENRGAATYCGSAFASDEGAPCAWPGGDGKRVYVYLRPDMRAFTPVAEILGTAGHSVLWFAPGLKEETARRFQSRTLNFVRHPVRLREVTSSADAVVLYGGHCTVSAFLLGGVPVGAFPLEVEHALIVRNVARIGAGAYAPAQASRDEMLRVLSTVVSDESYRARARDFAARYGGYDPREPAQRVALCVEQYCGMETA